MGKVEDLYPYDKGTNSYAEAAELVEATVSNSGNSDVDIDINIDTTPMAYAMLCSMRATDQLSEHEFRKAVRKLENFSRRNRYYRGMNDTSKVRLNKRRTREV
ncbi:hypothetical protein ACFOGI_09795 [Virgibacillus xinjiangensis]|uniref:Uncharacterized protein n=1 Tax=Virgibacillus xinjiangensis TaxID=393090 RepID=A0ABV7CVS9_9BACI